MGATDRRSLRTRLALRDALAAEIEATGDLSQVTVTAVTRRADVTRRTFYSHYRDIPALVAAIEDDAIEHIAPLVRAISQVDLRRLEEAIRVFEPCPGAEELLAYFRANEAMLSVLLGEGGDPAFVEKLKHMVRNVVEERARDGFSAVVEAGFDYYLTFVISAEVGVLVRWLTTGCPEPDAMMARIMTILLFIRPGDLYGRPIDFDLLQVSAGFAEQGRESIHG